MLDPFGHCRPNNQSMRSECRMCSGPGLKAAHATFDFERIHRPVDQTIFAFQDWGEGGFFVRLSFGLDVIEASQRFAEQIGSRLSESRKKFGRSFVRLNLRRSLQEDRSGIQLLN